MLRWTILVWHGRRLTLLAAGAVLVRRCWRLALLIAVVIAFFCTLGQGVGSWISFGVYMALGVALWLYLVLFKWRNTKIVIDTPDGKKEY